MPPSLKCIAVIAVFTLVTGAALQSVNATSRPSPPVAVADNNASPIYGVTIPTGYRDWNVISVAHEAGNNNDLRAILGNDIAIKTYREGKLPFPDGAIIARLAWTYVPSDENDKVLGPGHSFVAGPPINLQLSVKDSKKYAATGGWGFAQFKDGKAADKAVHKTCLPCHEVAKTRDFVYTHYSPTP
jgi:hypothetical protein